MISADELGRRVGEEIGISEWLKIDQPLIDAFADLTEDRQFIHIDPDRAATDGPYGTTIAHGFLTLSVLPALAASALPTVGGVKSSLNYGFDRVRFLAPVPVGARIRARFTLKRHEMRQDGSVLSTWQVRVEVEGSDRPALIAEWLGLRHLESQAA